MRLTRRGVGVGVAGVSPRGLTACLGAAAAVAACCGVGVGALGPVAGAAAAAGVVAGVAAGVYFGGTGLVAVLRLRVVRRLI